MTSTDFTTPCTEANKVIRELDVEALIASRDESNLQLRRAVNAYCVLLNDAIQHGLWQTAIGYLHKIIAIEGEKSE